MKAAERSWNVLKAANVREGFDRKDDMFPEQLLKSRILYFYGNVKLMRELVDKLLDDYYDERGWDIKKGIPLREKLMELGLESVASEIL